MEPVPPPRTDAPAPPPSTGVPEAGAPAPQGRQTVAQGRVFYDEKAATERVVRRLKELELEEKQGRLLRVDDVTEAMVKAGRRIGESLDALPMGDGDDAE